MSAFIKFELGSMVGIKLCLSQFQLGTSPRATQGFSSKNLPGGLGFSFWKLLGGREFDKDGDFVDNESETSKKIAWIKFFYRWKQKQAEFFTFLEVYFFCQWNFSWSLGQLFGSAITHTLQKIWGVVPDLFIFDVFTGLWLSTPTFVQKRFVRVLILSVINTGCPKNLLKMGTLHCRFPAQTMLKRHIMCAQEAIYVPRFFGNFSETACMQVGFDVRISPVWWMRAVSRRWEISVSFVFLDFTSTCGEQPFRACLHDPGTAHCLGATHWPQGQLCLGAWSEVCNCSHEFLLAPGQLREVGYPLYNTR